MVMVSLWGVLSAESAYIVHELVLILRYVSNARLAQSMYLVFGSRYRRCLISRR